MINTQTHLSGVKQSVQLDLGIAGSRSSQVKMCRLQFDLGPTNVKSIQA
jgi:hypothetical protein